MTRDHTFLTLGSPAYNTASEVVEAEFAPIARFSGVGIVLPAGFPATDVLCGFVVRAEHPKTKQIAFYAAGPSEPGTAAAGRYLLDNWDMLAKRHKDTAALCAVVRATSPDGRTYDVLA